MKKKYMIPAVEITKVELQQMIASSPLNLNETGGSGSLQDEEATGDALSRYNDWDD